MTSMNKDRIEWNEGYISKWIGGYDVWECNDTELGAMKRGGKKEDYYRTREKTMLYVYTMITEC